MTSTGIVTGGWDYVTAAYAVTWLVFAAYGLSLRLRASTSTGGAS